MRTDTKKILILLLVLIGFVSCSDDDDDVRNTKLYSGSDISTYCTITANKETKKTSIRIMQDGLWKLFSGDNTDNMNFDTPVLSGTVAQQNELNEITYQLFCLEWAENSRAVFAPRQLPVEGQPNFRDLGGYKTKSGRFVKWGTVFRSGKCNELTDTDIDFLATIPLKTVVDFRSNQERDAEPDKVPETVTQQLHYAIEPGNLSTVDISKAIQEGDIEACKQYMKDANKTFVLSCRNEFKTFFNTLQEAGNTPLMFHCTAGKDRAGFASAMFLLALGVDKETVIEDYLLTNVCADVTVEGMKEKYGDNDMAVCMYYIYSVQREYIETAFSTIESEYGNVESFLTNQLQININKLQSMYLY